MSGKRLIVGLVVMGAVVPAILFFALGLETVSQLFVVSATCFVAWGAADLVADILSRPRLADRSPGRALRELDMQRPEKPKE
jgi:hypothetical protein